MRVVLLYPAADGKLTEARPFTVSSGLIPSDKIELWAASVPVSGAASGEEGLIILLEKSLRELLGLVLDQ